jgi:hypothetical protein
MTKYLCRRVRLIHRTATLLAIPVLRKGFDGRWRVALDISNSDVAPVPVGEP